MKLFLIISSIVIIILSCLIYFSFKKKVSSSEEISVKYASKIVNACIALTVVTFIISLVAVIYRYK